MKKTKKYGTLDQALTKGTGMDKKEREKFRTDIYKLMDDRKKAVKNGDAKLEAKLRVKIEKMMGLA